MAISLKAHKDDPKLIDLIQHVRVAMLVTKDDDGHAHARPMWTQKQIDGDPSLWFFAGRDSETVKEISRDPRMLLTYADAHHNKYVSVKAHATALKDPAIARELWNVHLEGWWPGGPESDEFRLVRVEPQAAEWWDGPSNTMYMISLAKAVITGGKPKLPTADHGKIGNA